MLPSLDDIKNMQIAGMETELKNLKDRENPFEWKKQTETPEI